MDTAPINVLAVDLTGDQLADAVHQRTLTSQLRRTLGSAAVVHAEGVVYWPIAVIEATADGQWMRKRWTERGHGAVDLLTGRTGLFEGTLPATARRRPARHERLTPEHSRAATLDRWHEFFRDHVERRRKPLKPPAYRVDSLEQVWIPHHVVSCGGQRFLVDPISHRADPMNDFPKVCEQLADHAPVPQP